MRWKSSRSIRGRRRHTAIHWVAMACLANATWGQVLAHQPPEIAPAKPSVEPPVEQLAPVADQTASIPNQAAPNPTLPPSAPVQPLESLEQGAYDPFLKTIQQRGIPLGPTPLSDPSGSLKLRTPQRIQVPGTRDVSRQRVAQQPTRVHPSTSRRWLTAESLLRSARWLEEDAIQADQSGREEEAIALRSMAESLREQVQRLLALPR
jgi:hypothetical protein